MGGPNPEAVPNPKEIAMLLARFACNNHTICDDELRPLGNPLILHDQELKGGKPTSSD